MMRQLVRKLLTGRAEAKKSKKNSEMMLKLFFLAKKVAKIKMAESSSAFPTP